MPPPDPTSSPVRTPAELQAIARCAEHLRWVIFAVVGAYVFVLTQESQPIKLFLYGATTVAQIIVVYRLGRALRLSTVLLIGRCLLCAVPTICFICLAAMMSDARAVLTRRER